MSKFVKLVGVVLGVALLLPVLSLAADEPEASELPPPIATVGAQFSDEVQQFNVDVLVPVWIRGYESGKGMVAIDPRGSFLENKEQEFNFGIIYRQLIEDKELILGANAFYDSRWTQYDNQFDQFGFGLEALSKWVDARFNYYLPEDDRKEIDSYEEQDVSQSSSTSRGTPYMVGNVIRQNVTTVTTTTTTTRRFARYEEALEGFDVEAGARIPYLPEWLETRAFVGYYDFNVRDGDDINGIKGRLEVRPVPAIIIDAEVTEDDVLNGTDFFVGFRIRLPFDFWNGGDSMRDAFRPAEMPFESRMSDMVMRDFRIRTSETMYEQISQSESSSRSTKRGKRIIGYIPPPPPPPEPEPEQPNGEYQDMPG